MRSVPQITVQEAAARIRSGDVLIVGGFGMTGSPTKVMHAIAETDLADLTYIGNNVGEPGLAGRTLPAQGTVQKSHRLIFHQQPGSRRGGPVRESRS